MNNFSWYKAIGFGVLIWLIMFAVVSGLVGFGVTFSVWLSTVIALLSGFLAYVLSFYLDTLKSTQALSYGIIWVAVGLVLDYAISRQFNSGIFASWQYWLGYALVLFAPWVQTESVDQTGVQHLAS